MCTLRLHCILYYVHEMQFDLAIKYEQQKMFNSFQSTYSDVLLWQWEEGEKDQSPQFTHIDRHFSLFLSFIKHNHHSYMQAVFSFQKPSEHGSNQEAQRL